MKHGVFESWSRRIILMSLLPAVAAGTALAAPKPPVSWEKGWWGRIDLDTVCTNYQRGTDIYRACREHAVEVFRDRCEHYTEKVDTSAVGGSQYNENRRSLYCRAMRDYEPFPDE